MSLLGLTRKPTDYYALGCRFGKQASDLPLSYALAGKLYLADSGYLMLSVPNGLVRGVFEQLDEIGLELPPGPNGVFNAHISVARPEELVNLDGGQKITERGHIFHYNLGPLRTVDTGAADISKWWVMQVTSPELSQLRRSYGLPSLPHKNGSPMEFHISVAVRKRGVLRNNETAKASSDTSAVLRTAREATNTSPTEAQQEAGNYKKGKLRLHGLAISLENPKGSTRSGVSKDGKKWSSKMKSDYGYFQHTLGKDGDHVDMFIGPRPDCELAFIVNQVDPGSGRFDEHKVLLGWDNEEEARAGYLANYETGWKGLGAISSLTVGQLKWWLEHGDTTKAIEDGMFAKHRKTASAEHPGHPDFKLRIRKQRVRTEEYDVCPHCEQEIHEKGLYYDNETGYWYHRGCPDKPIDYDKPHSQKTQEERDADSRAFESRMGWSTAEKDAATSAASQVTSDFSAGYFESPENTEDRRCPGCNELFKECEPYPDVTLCEICERYGPPQEKKAALLPGAPPLQPQQVRVREQTEDDPNTRLLLFHGLGSGKTRTSLVGAETAGEPYTAIVPASLRENFRGEQAKWTDQTLPSNVTSYNALAQGGVPATDTLIMDEAQRLRNDQSQQTQQAMALADQAQRLYLLSGTPVVNHPADLAPLMSMLTGDRISREDFTKKYVGQETAWPGVINWLRGVPTAKIPKLQNRDDLKERLQGHVDYQPAPETGIRKHEERFSVPMSSEQEKLYQGFWGQLPWVLRWKLRNEFPLSDKELKNLSSFLSGPRQVSLSTLPFMGAKRDPYKAFEQSPKLQLAFNKVQQALKQNPNFRGVAFSNFIDAGLTPYQAALAKANIPAAIFHGGLSDGQRKQMVADYNAGKLRMLLLGPSGGEGISLKGTNVLQVLDPHWNEARTRQAIGRGIRFDSHADMSPEERRIKIQRFASELPPGTLSRLWRWLVQTKPNDKRNEPGTDAYLENLADDKQKLNDEFLEVLKEVGQQRA